MKIRPYTWKLAGAYLLCGVMVFLIMTIFLRWCSNANIPFPIFSTAVFAVGPLGWLMVMLVIGALVVLKDFRFRSRFLNPVFTAILTFLMCGIMFAMAAVWYECESIATLSA
jgi:hypothetical protein